MYAFSSAARDLTRAYYNPDINFEYSKFALLELPVVSTPSAAGENYIQFENLIAVDATASGNRARLPHKWSSAVFDSRAWEGPAGLAVVAIADAANWKNPLPHISAVRRTYGTFSLPLLIASAVALSGVALSAGPAQAARPLGSTATGCL